MDTKVVKSQLLLHIIRRRLDAPVVISSPPRHCRPIQVRCHNAAEVHRPHPVGCIGDHHVRRGGGAVAFTTAP